MKKFVLQKRTKNANGVLLFFLCNAALAGSTHAGYEAPPHIDGCQSVDGRFAITAECTERAKTSHGPHKWDFVWRDTREDITKRYPAKGVQGGQVYAQLFIAPDGETFALFNHVTLWEPEKSHMHGPKDLPHHEDTEKWRNDHRFSKRLIIYRKDGDILKEFSIADLLQPEEWETVGRSFNRIHWIEEYDGLNFKETPRTQYAFYRVSPDYTVLEVLAKRPRKSKAPPRPIRISLTDGRLIKPDEKLPPEKTPVRPYQGDDHLPKGGQPWKESYTPSLDPVRTAGSYEIVTSDVAFPTERAPKLPEFKHGKVELIRDGFTKADTPSWLKDAVGRKKTSGLLFTDLEQGKLFQFVPPDSIEELRPDATRGCIGNDRKFYGLIDGNIARWLPGGKNEPEILVAKALEETPVSVNDLVVSSRGLVYFTTLKDPEKGRLSVLDPETKKVTVMFDGEDEPALANPNGIALSRHERFLYVGISNYKKRSHSGVYCFPIRGDGTINVEAGKQKKWANVKAPDGIAVDKPGNVFFTAGNTVHAFDRYGRKWGTIRLPKGSGTNLCFGENEKTLFITTWNALYRVELK